MVTGRSKGFGAPELVFSLVGLLLGLSILAVASPAFAAEVPPADDDCSRLFSDIPDKKIRAGQAYFRFLSFGLKSDALKVSDVEAVLENLEKNIVINPFAQQALGGEKDGSKRGVDLLIRQQQLDASALIVGVRELLAQHTTTENEKARTRDESRLVYAPKLRETVLLPYSHDEAVESFLFTDAQGETWFGATNTAEASEVVFYNVFDSKRTRKIVAPNGSHRSLIVTPDGRELWTRSVRQTHPHLSVLTDSYVQILDARNGSVLAESAVDRDYNANSFAVAKNHHGDFVVVNVQIHSRIEGDAWRYKLQTFDIQKNRIAKLAFTTRSKNTPTEFHVNRSDLGEKILSYPVGFSRKQAGEAFNLTRSTPWSLPRNTSILHESQNGELMYSAFSTDGCTQQAIASRSLLPSKTDGALDFTALPSPAEEICKWKQDVYEYAFVKSTEGRAYAWAKAGSPLQLHIIDLAPPYQKHIISDSSGADAFIAGATEIQIITLKNKTKKVLVTSWVQDKLAVTLVDLENPAERRRIILRSHNGPATDSWPIQYVQNSNGEERLLRGFSNVELDTYDLMSEADQAEVKP